METLNNFSAHQVENGWIVEVGGGIGCCGKKYVFGSLGELAEWLKVQVVRDVRSERG